MLEDGIHKAYTHLHGCLISIAAVISSMSPPFFFDLMSPREKECRNTRRKMRGLTDNHTCIQTMISTSKM